jgi:hypothetical protein
MATPLALLQFLVFKNYASILEDEYNNDSKKPRELAEKALDHYINVRIGRLEIVRVNIDL